MGSCLLLRKRRPGWQIRVFLSVYDEHIGFLASSMCRTRQGPQWLASRRLSPSHRRQRLQGNLHQKMLRKPIATLKDFEHDCPCEATLGRSKGTAWKIFPCSKSKSRLTAFLEPDSINIFSVPSSLCFDTGGGNSNGFWFQNCVHLLHTYLEPELWVLWSGWCLELSAYRTPRGRQEGQGGTLGLYFSAAESTKDHFTRNLERKDK